MLAWHGRLVLCCVVGTLAVVGLAPTSEADPDDGRPAAHRSYPGDDGVIIFIRQGQVHSIAADGSDEKQLTQVGSNSSPRWGPYGLRIAFVHERRDGSRDIWLMARDGTHRRQVTHDGDVTAPTWSPDGRWLAFGSPMQMVRARAPFGAAVDVMGRLGPGAPQRLSVVGSLAWSPDGTTIAYYSDQYPRSPDNYLLTYDVASQAVSVFWEIGGPCCGEGYFADLAWTPDSSAIGYTDGYYEPESGPRPLPRISVYTFPSQDRLDFVLRRGDAQPTFAPSGQRMVLKHQRSAAPALYVADTSGSHRRLLARGHDPDWQPLPAS